MNISMIEMVSSHGGCNYYDYGLMNGLGKLGCKVTLYTSSELKFDISDNKNLCVKLFYEGIYSGKNKIKRFCKYLWGTYKSLQDSKKRGAQVVHFQIYAITILEILVLWLIKRFRFPVVVTVHDVESFNKENSKRGIRFFYNNVDRIIVHNRISYETLASCLKDYDNGDEILSRCSVIHHGSYIGQLPEKIDKRIAKQKFSIESDCFTFLFFGQIKRVKGLDVLMEAFSKLVKSCDKKVKLIIAGKVWKDDFEIYEKIIKENNLSEYLILDIKYIDDAEIVSYYSAADCIVLPYKKIFQSGVLLMAQSYQVPVIVSDLQGMTEIVTDGKNGFVFQTENSDSLCQKMKQVMEFRNNQELLQNAYQKLQTEYNWDDIARQQIEVMQGICKKL